MNYKMIVMDLDDTLVKADGTISERTINAVQKAQENGIYVVLASGRAESGIFPVAKQLNLCENTGYVLSFNGGKIFKYGENTPVYECGVNEEQIKLLYKLGVENDVSVLTYSSTQVIASRIDEYVELEGTLANMPVRIAENFTEESPKVVGKIMYLAEPKHLLEVKEKLAPILEKDLYAATSKPFFLEYTNKTVNKGKSLIKLAEIVGVKIEEIIACGDGNNDISMLETAGLGVAMENASDKVKGHADIVTKSCENDGVAHIIEKILL